MRIELDSEHIKDLDNLVRIALSKEEEVLVDYNLTLDPYSLSLGKAEFYLEILEEYGLADLGSDNKAYLLKLEKCRVHINSGGFNQLAIDKQKIFEEEQDNKLKKQELTGLQLKQMKHQTKQMIFKSWWFWLAAAMVSYSFVRQIIEDFS